MSENVVTRIDNIEKSKGDCRTYRGLDIYLYIIIRNMSEPKDLPGLAHFCEHMLFMGTKKFPGENEFSQFLTKSCGSYNAYTANDHANYYFSTETEALRPSLDRFAQFFIALLFTTSAIEREIDAVNPEHDKNVADYLWRLSQLAKNAADPNHSHNKFGTESIRSYTNTLKTIFVTKCTP